MDEDKWMNRPIKEVLENEKMFLDMVKMISWDSSGTTPDSWTFEDDNVNMNISFFNAVCPICGKYARKSGDVIVCENCKPIEEIVER